MSVFIELLKAIKAKHSLTNQQIADSIGISRQGLYEMERGKYYPSTEILESLCRVYGYRLEIKNG